MKKIFHPVILHPPMKTLIVTNPRFYNTQSCDLQYTIRTLTQRLIQVPQNVVNVFDADAQAHEIG